MIFMDDLKERLTNRVQLTSDGHRPYLEAVAGTFGDDIDYAMLQKIYTADIAGERRYSPARCVGAVKREIAGNPDPSHVQHVLRRAPEPHNADAHEALHAYVPMRSAKKSKTTHARLRCIRCITISSGCIKHSKSVRQWPLA